jgi:hypothetical protein
MDPVHTITGCFHNKCTCGTVTADRTTIETSGDVTCSDSSADVGQNKGSDVCEKWQNLNILEWHWQIKTANREKLWGTFSERLLPFGERLLPFGAKHLVFLSAVEVKEYRMIQLPVVLCGCEALFPTWREECSLRVFENGVLREVFGPKSEETHDGSLVRCCWAAVIRVMKSRRMRWARHVVRKERKCRHGFGWKTWRKQAAWKTKGEMGIILKWVL